LRGEGRVPILYGSSTISVGTLTHHGYLARPDLAGEWPTVIVVASEWGVTSSMKDLCRRLARHGFAAIAPDLYRGDQPPRRASAEEAYAASRRLPPARVASDLAAIVDFVRNPAGFWSSAERGFGVVGFGDGGRFAAVVASGHADAALALVAARLPAEDAAPGIAATLRTVVGPVLGLTGREDSGAPLEAVHAARQAAPQSEWVIYDGVGGQFTDDFMESFDAAAHQDALERLVAFFDKHLPAPPA
jgi:carboxymethylenebutenolidase